MTCKSKKESVVLRVMLGSTLHNWTQKSEIPQVSTLMCIPGLFGLCRGCRVGLAACKQGCWLWQTLENPIIVRSFRATRRCIYYKMGGNYFCRGIVIFIQEKSGGTHESEWNYLPLSSMVYRQICFSILTNLEIIETWNQNSSFKNFRVVRKERQIRSFVFGRSYGSTILCRDLLTL